MIIVLFGVAGAGKTTIGRMLSAELGWKFYDADDAHSPADVEAMRRGIPLTDSDRRPWLDQLRRLIGEWLQGDENVILACSALKEVYRRHLQVAAAVHFVYLQGPYSMIEERLEKRGGHFMNPALLRSQFDLLEEPPGETLRIDVKKDLVQIVRAIRNAFRI